MSTTPYGIDSCVNCVNEGHCRLLPGLAQLGALVNFVSLSVLVGFTSGAACLIGINRLGNVLGVSGVQASSAPDTLKNLLAALPPAPETPAQTPLCRPEDSKRALRSPPSRG